MSRDREEDPSEAPDEGTVAVVLDVLPRGRSEDSRPRYRRSPVGFLLGTEDFGLYEVLLAEDSDISIGDRVAIDGPNVDTSIEEVGRTTADDLTGGARSELEYVIDEIIEANEDRFVEFFNEAQPITTRLHSLDLLPGIGNTLRNNIIDTRRRTPFEGLEDLENRVSGLHDPAEIIANRIHEELTEQDLKYRLFVRSR